MGSSCAQGKFEQKTPVKVKRNHNAAWRYVRVVGYVQKALHVRAGECTDFVFCLQSSLVEIPTHRANFERK